MTYQEASKIGSVLDGYIKCTYAMLHDAKGGKLFSLQHADITRQNSAKEDFNKSVSAAADVNTDDTFWIEDFAVVYTDPELEQPKDDRWVAVRLTDKALDVLNKKIRRTGEQVRSGWQQFSKYGVYYVKKCAIEWIPTNADNQKVEIIKDGKITQLNADIQAAKKKLDNAKAILAMASATMII